jgi:arsenate reductase (glutaredoxin)
MALALGPLPRQDRRMMKARIWHNPQCSKSRQALERLRAIPGMEVDVIDYLRTPPTAETLARLYASAGMAARDGLRTTGTDARERGLIQADDGVVIAAMVADPRLIERPLVETEKGVRLCRPPERIDEIL